MVHFIGAGPGAADLITVRGLRLLQEADVVIYAGSLVNPALLESCRPDCEKHNSAFLTLEEVLAIIADAEAGGKTTARLHTGDPSVYGAIREQMDALDRMGVSYTITPAAIVYKATWPDERVCRCTVGTLAETGRHEGITKTALLLIGGFLAGDYERSRLYAPDFSTEFRAAAGEEQP